MVSQPEKQQTSGRRRDGSRSFAQVFAQGVARIVPGFGRLQANRMRPVLMTLFLLALALATVQMLAPNLLWQRLSRITRGHAPQSVGWFWRPILVHPDVYRPRLNRELYAVDVWPEGLVWVGGEQGLLASSADHGETWQCYTFESATGIFDNPHDCSAGNSEGSVASVTTFSPWKWGLAKVYAAQSQEANKNSPVQANSNSANPPPVNPSKNRSSTSALRPFINGDPIVLSETLHDFGDVAINRSKTFNLIVKGVDSSTRAAVSNLKFSNGAPFKILGSQSCTLQSSGSCGFSVMFAPNKPGPISDDLTLFVQILPAPNSQSSTSAPVPRPYVIHLSGYGVGPETAQPGSAATTSTGGKASSTATSQNNGAPSFTAGDIVYIDDGHLVMVDHGDAQVLVAGSRFGHGTSAWIRPGRSSLILHDHSDFSALPTQINPTTYLRTAQPCPVVPGNQSFEKMFMAELSALPANATRCSSVKNGPGVHLNAIVAPSSHTENGLAIHGSGYAVGGRRGEGVIYRVDVRESEGLGFPINLYTPITHAAAVDTLIFPVGMKLPAPWFYVVLVCCIASMWLVWVRIPETSNESTSQSSTSEGIEGMAVNDRPLEPEDADAVRLRAVADGISRFFRNPSTMAPLVLCINGSWGWGKSSLMNLLADDLKHHVGNRHTVIGFNAWHHQSEDQILASLLQSVRTNALRAPWTPMGVWTRLRIFIKRWPERWFVSVVFSIAAVWSSALAVDFLRYGHLDLGKVAAFFPAFVTTMITLRTIAQGFTGFLANPASLLAVDGKGSTAQMEAQTTVRERFARDFSIVTQVLGNGKLVILIDDLDRCQPEKIREVVEAINFLVTAGECYIVLGMAREVVEYYLGQSFSASIKTMPLSLLGISEDQAKADGARESAFARLYLQKMIQLQFNLLPLTDDQAISLFQNSSSRGAGESVTDYTVQTRSLLRFEQQLRRLQQGLQTWFIPVMGTILLVVGASMTVTGSARYVQRQVTPLLGTPDKTKDGPAATGTPNSSSTSDTPSPATTSKGTTAPGATPSQGMMKTNDTKSSADVTPPSSDDGIDVTAFKPVYPEHDPNETVAPDAVQKTRSGPGVVQILLMVIFLIAAMWMLAQWWLVVVPEAENARDSAEFLTALSDWAPLLLQIYKTPRGLKQYLNSVRFLAMLQRSQAEPGTGGSRQPLVRRIALSWVAGSNEDLRKGVLDRLQRQTRAGMSGEPIIPDALLVALAALHSSVAVMEKSIPWMEDPAIPNVSLMLEAGLQPKLDAALKAAAALSRMPDLGSLRVALRGYRKTFCRLNGVDFAQQAAPSTSIETAAQATNGVAPQML